MSAERRPGIAAICDADARAKDPAARALADLVAADWMADSYASVFPALDAEVADLVPHLVQATAVRYTRLGGTHRAPAPDPEERA